MAVSAFSSSDEAVLQRRLSVGGDASAVTDVVAYYDLQDAVTWITRGGYKRVALQFPDELLPTSPAVARYLTSHTSALVFILGDTSYGSCCVDEVAAEHASADAVIHLGHSCLSPSRRLPLKYCLGRANLDLEACLQRWREEWSGERSFVVVLDTEFYHAYDQLKRLLAEQFPEAVCSQIDWQSHKESQTPADKDQPCEDQPGDIVVLGRRFNLPEGRRLEDCDVVYVGHNERVLTNLLMNLAASTFYTHDPASDTLSKVERSRQRELMRRYYMIERCRDAAVVGILMGTLGVERYREVLARLKALVKAAGKRCYTVAVGKPNPAKLANLMEIDVYVLVACPENCLLDSSDFYRPVVTPFEAELAFNPEQEWTGVYSTDYRNILPGGKHYVEAPEGSVPATPSISLITGGMRKLGREEEEEGAEGKELVARDANMALAENGPGAGFLATRSWQGLEPALGQTPAARVEKGQTGLAVQYEGEPDS